LAIDEFLHVIVGEELTHLTVATELEEAKFFRSPGISSNALDGDKG
jgi:hypothetical protein